MVVNIGVGGPARYFAQTHGVHVTGIDLSSDYVAAANALTRRYGLDDLVVFQEANALHLPSDDATFDGAYTVHAAMKINDKARMFAEVRRVLKPAARFGVYDIMRAKNGEIPYPMPLGGNRRNQSCRAAGDISAIARRIGVHARK